MSSSSSLPRRVTALEERMGMGPQSEQIFVYRGLDETEDQALVRHFDSKGPPLGAEVVMYGFTPLAETEG